MIFLLCCLATVLFCLYSLPGPFIYKKPDPLLNLQTHHSVVGEEPNTQGGTGYMHDAVRTPIHTTARVENASSDAVVEVTSTEGPTAGDGPTSSHRFLYLLQTEKCIPSNLRTNEALGNGNLDFDVLVLSFKHPCDDHALSHVQYIFGASTTWTTGRNLLFETAMKWNTTYLYYIFMDDDVMLEDSEDRTVSPWRKFEAFLLSVEPAIAATDLQSQDLLGRLRRTHKAKGCARREDAAYIGTLWYDAIFNAFHAKAVKHLLPYISTFDQQTWWASQMGLIVRSEVLFRGQIAFLTKIHPRSGQSRPYPRDLNFTPDMYRQFTSGLDAHLGPKCRTTCAQAMIDQWIAYGSNHGWDSVTLCLPPPPAHDPVEPCRYQCDLLK